MVGASKTPPASQADSCTVTAAGQRQAACAAQCIDRRRFARSSTFSLVSCNGHEGMGNNAKGAEWILGSLGSAQGLLLIDTLFTSLGRFHQTGHCPKAGAAAMAQIQLTRVLGGGASLLTFFALTLRRLSAAARVSAMEARPSSLQQVWSPSDWHARLQSRLQPDIFYGHLAPQPQHSTWL